MDFDEFWEKLEGKIDEKIAAATKPVEDKPAEQNSFTKEELAEIIRQQNEEAANKIRAEQQQTNFEMYLKSKTPDFLSHLEEATDMFGRKISDQINSMESYEDRVSALDAYEKSYKQAAAKSGAPQSTRQRKVAEQKQAAETKYEELADKRANNELSGTQYKNEFWNNFEQELANAADAA